MISEEIQRRLAVLKQSAQDFLQMTNVIDGNFESRLNEIKALELKRDKVKKDLEETQVKANRILQDASELASTERKEAARLLDEAKTAKIEAKEEQRRAETLKAEAQSLMNQAIQRQKEADVQYRLVEDKAKKIMEAMR